MSINHPGTLESQLQIEIYLTELRHEYLPNDVFDSLSSEYINPTADAPHTLPDAIYLKLKAEADNGRTCKVAMLKDLTQAPTIGSNGNQVGNEEDITTKYFKMEYTDLSHATTNQQYGIHAREKAPYDIFGQRVELLARYYKQYFGKMRRQALLQIQSENLEDAPHFLSPGFSPNWFIPNTTFANQPVYTLDSHDWTDRIALRINQAGNSVQCCASLNYLNYLEEYARTVKLITPLNFADGGDGYIVLLPTPQITWLMHTIQEGGAGGMFKHSAQLDQNVVAKYPNMVAQYRGLRIIADDRYPTLTLGGAASDLNGKNTLSDGNTDYTITAQYRGMGQADDGSSDPRDKTANAVQVGFLLGQAALCEWMPEGFHWEWDYAQYDKFFGSGVFCGVGIKQPIFNVTGGTAGSVQQNGSIVLPFRVPPQTTYYTNHVAQI